MTKITYTDALNTVLANENIETEVREKLEALVAQLAKRNAKGGERKLTKTQKENAEIKASFVEYINDHADQAFRANEIADHFGFSGQKVSALLNQLVKDGVIAKVTEKRVTTFKAVDAE